MELCESISSSGCQTADAVQNMSSLVKEECPRLIYRWLLIASMVMMMGIIVAGVFGNVLVCLSMYTCRSLRTANNALLLNLAVADLLACLFYTPLLFATVIQATFFVNAVMPRFLCVVQVWLRFVCSSVQQMTLCAISAQRYTAIVHPLKKKGTKERVLAAVIITWTVSCSLSVLAVLLHSSPTYDLCPCSLQNGNPTNLVDLYISGPLGTICLLSVVLFYALIFRTVWKHVKEKESKTSDKTDREKERTFPQKYCSRLLEFIRVRKSNVVVPVDTNLAAGLHTHDLLQGSSSLEAVENSKKLASDSTSFGATPDRFGGDKFRGAEEKQLGPANGSPNRPLSVKIERETLDSSRSAAVSEGVNQSLRDTRETDRVKHDVTMDNLPHIQEDHASLECSAVIRNEVNSPRFALNDTNGARTPDIVVSQTDIINQKDEIEGTLASSKNCKLSRTSDCAPIAFPAVEIPSHLDNECSPISARSAACELHIDCHVKNNEEKPSSDNDSNIHSSVDPSQFKEGVFRPGENSTNNAGLDILPAPPDVLYGDVCVMKPKSRERGRRKLEAKTAKRALFIIAAFVVCWLPMSVITYLEMHVELLVDIKVFFLTFALLSAVINPLIYTFINTAYRNEFKRLLKKAMFFRR